MKQTLYHYKAIITDIYDADTVTADISLGCGVWLRGQKLRLFGIDAPEMRGPEKPQGIISRDWLRARLLPLAEGIFIQTIKDKTGKFGRLLAILYRHDMPGRWINLNELMVEKGYAVKKEY